MQIFRDMTSFPDTARGTVLALGNFDGVHRGHQAILSQVTDMARHENTTPAVMTFEPHPRAYFSSDGRPVCIYRFRQKVALFAKAGIKTLFVVRFNQKLASTSAQSFVEELLHKQLAVRHVITGYNFAFGKGREGNTEFLAGQGHQLGFGFTALPAIEDGAQVISTSAIRKALAIGDVARASTMLGHTYAIEGRVMQGDKRGRQIGFPTANISLQNLFAPCFGVYAARINVGGTLYNAVCNVGVKPTFSGTKPLLEAHIFDFDQTIYGHLVSVELHHFIRAEQKFSGIEELKKQIEKDVAIAKAYCLEGVS